MKALPFLHFVYPPGKPMIPHLLCYQGFAVEVYGFTLNAADLGHPQLSLNEGNTLICILNLSRFRVTWIKAEGLFCLGPA
jgi:hypothetical protein